MADQTKHKVMVNDLEHEMMLDAEDVKRYRKAGILVEDDKKAPAKKAASSDDAKKDS